MRNDPSSSPPPLSRAEANQIAVERFGPFGRDVVGVVTDLVLDDGMMTTVLRRLGLPSDQKLDLRLAELFSFVAQHGDSPLLMEARRALRMRPPSNDEIVKKLESKKSSNPPGISAWRTTGDAAGEVVEPPPPPPPAPVEAAPPPAPPPQLEINPPAPPHGAMVQMPDGSVRQWIQVPGYSGPERRVGPVDRRSHRDRREDMHAVNKNRRFGAGRRRIPVGRRRTDAERVGHLYKNPLQGIIIQGPPADPNQVKK